MSDKQNLKNNILKLPSDIINEYETVLEYSSQKYSIKIKHKENVNDDIKDENEIIVISAEKENKIERFTFEKIMKFEDFKKLGKLFKLPDNIEEVYNFFLEMFQEKKINIKEIIQEKSLTLSMEEKFRGYKEPFFAEIVIPKKDRNKDELINILFKALEEKNKNDSGIDKEDQSSNNNDDEKSNEKISKKYSIEYFTFSPNGTKFYFNNCNSTRITKDTTILFTSSEQVFSFRKFSDPKSKKTFYETRLCYNNSGTNQSVTIYANSNEPAFYIKLGKITNLVYFYNSDNEIINYYYPFSYPNKIIHAVNIFPTDKFNIVNFPS